MTVSHRGDAYLGARPGGRVAACGELEPDGALLADLDGRRVTASVLRHGGDIVVLEGTAEVSDAPAATQVPEYLKKYRSEISRIGHDPDTCAVAYPTPLRFTPMRLRGF